MSNDGPSIPDDDGPSGMSRGLVAELRLALAGDMETDHELELALAQLRSDPLPRQVKQQGLEDREHDKRQHAVIQVWRSIADGSANLATRDTWVSAVAQQIVLRVLNPEVDSADRDRAALKAIGFRQRFPKDMEETDLLEVRRDFATSTDELDAPPGDARKAPAKQTRAEKARVARIMKKITPRT